MKRLSLACATALAVVLSSQAVAQQAVEIEPRYRVRIQEDVARKKVVPVTTIRERVTPGYRVPAHVRLRTVPREWGPSVRRYRYFYQEKAVHFVDPGTRLVVLGMGF